MCDASTLITFDLKDACSIYILLLIEPSISFLIQGHQNTLNRILLKMFNAYRLMIFFCASFASMSTHNVIEKPLFGMTILTG